MQETPAYSMPKALFTYAGRNGCTRIHGFEVELLRGQFSNECPKVWRVRLLREPT